MHTHAVVCCKYAPTWGGKKNSPSRSATSLERKTECY
jgi:hypothetical protein